MAGINDLIRDLPARCPECRKRLDLRKYVLDLFQQILERIAEGDRVKIRNFGSFETRYTPARPITLHDGKRVMVDGRMQLRLKVADKAKEVINIKHKIKPARPIPLNMNEAAAQEIDEAETERGAALIDEAVGDDRSADSGENQHSREGQAKRRRRARPKRSTD